MFRALGPTGNSSVLILTLGAAVPPGIYDLSVMVTGSVGTDSGLLTLRVVTP